MLGQIAQGLMFSLFKLKINYTDATCIIWKKHEQIWGISIKGIVIPYHYNDVIMTTMAFQITSLTIVYSTVNSDADQRKHQSSASLAFVWGIHRDRWIPRTKGQLRGKCFHLMTSSCGSMPETDWNWTDAAQNGLILHYYGTFLAFAM